MVLLTQFILLSTYLAKLHVYRDKEPPKRTAAPKEWPVTERCSSDKNPRGLLNTAVSTGERRKAGGDAAHHAGDSECHTGQLGLLDRNGERKPSETHEKRASFHATQLGLQYF